MKLLEKIDKYLNEKETTINTTEEALGVIEKKGYLWDIGQIDKKTSDKLGRLAKKGEINKEKALWPYIDSGTIKKNIYFHKNYTLDQISKLV